MAMVKCSQRSYALLWQCLFGSFKADFSFLSLPRKDSFCAISVLSAFLDLDCLYSSLMYTSENESSKSKQGQRLHFSSILVASPSSASSNDIAHLAKVTAKVRNDRLPLTSSTRRRFRLDGQGIALQQPHHRTLIHWDLYQHSMGLTLNHSTYFANSHQPSAPFRPVTFHPTPAVPLFHSSPPTSTTRIVHPFPVNGSPRTLSQDARSRHPPHRLPNRTC